MNSLRTFANSLDLLHQKMEKREFKDTVYGEVAGLTKALSNPHRIEIVELLANGEKTVEQIAKETALSFANASQHLQQLKKVRLVSVRKEKNYIFYKLSNPYVYAIWKALREFSRYHIPEIDRSIAGFHLSNDIETITSRDLGKYQPYTLLDVRPKSEYDAHHIEGALNLTHRDLPDNLYQLSQNKTIITYCRGPFCTMAAEAGKFLKENGFRVLRLEESALDISN